MRKSTRTTRNTLRNGDKYQARTVPVSVCMEFFGSLVSIVNNCLRMFSSARRTRCVASERHQHTCISVNDIVCARCWLLNDSGDCQRCFLSHANEVAITRQTSSSPSIVVDFQSLSLDHRRDVGSKLISTFMHKNEQKVENFARTSAEIHCFETHVLIL